MSLRKRKCGILKRIWADLLILTLLFGVLPGSGMEVKASSDDETVSQTTRIRLNVEYRQEEARKVADLVNAFRAEDDLWCWDEKDTEKVSWSSVPGLQYDYKLEQVAMQRAAELAVSYSHTRPNGERCFTAYEEYGYICSNQGENICVASYESFTAEQAFLTWREENEKYAGQGHRRNMLNGQFTAIGMGYVYYNGCHYWAMELANPATDEKDFGIDGEQSIPVEVMNKDIESLYTEKMELEYTSEADIPTVYARVYTENTWPKEMKAQGAIDVDWVIADSSVVTIKDGKFVSSAEEFETKATASAVGKSLEIVLKSPSKDDNTGDTGNEGNTGSNTGNEGNTGNNTGNGENTGSNTGDTGNGGNTGSNTGDTENGGNTGSNTGDTGNGGSTGSNTGDTGNGGNTGSNTGDTGNGGNTGSNIGDTGNGGNIGNNTGDTGNEGNTGSNIGDTGNGGNTGNNAGDIGNEGNTGSNTGDTGNAGNVEEDQNGSSVSTNGMGIPVINVNAVKYNTLRLTWNSVSGAKNYEIFYSTAPDAGFKRLTRTKKTSYNFSKAACGQTYYFQVRACGKGKNANGELSRIVSGVTDLTGVPSVHVTKTTYNSVTLKWNKILGAKKYDIYYSESPADGWKLLTRRGGTSYTHKKLLTGATYYYQIRPVRDSFVGEWSNEVSGTTVLGNVSGLKAKAKGTNNIQISWKKVPGVSQYVILRSDHENGEYEIIGNSVKASYMDMGLVDGSMYFYKVYGISGPYRTNVTGAVGQITKAN